MANPADIITIAPPASIFVTYNAMNEQFRQAEEGAVGVVGDGNGWGAGRPAGWPTGIDGGWTSEMTKMTSRPRLH